MNNVLWSPIDLPKCPIIPSLNLTSNWKYWNFRKLTETAETPYSITTWNKEVKEKYPELINWFELLPIKTLRNVKMNSQIDTVKSHIDFTTPSLDPELWINNQINEPCGYRVLLNGLRKNKLYVIDDNKKIYCNMPEDTDVYVLGHTTTLHGVDEDINRLTFFIHIEVDADRHRSIINRSLEKYSRYVIYKNAN